MKFSIASDKAFKFSIRIVNLYKFLTSNKREYVLSKQILRSGTSIGANIEETLGGQTNKDFFSKMTISYKETRETMYWLKLLNATNYLSNHQFNSISNDCDELLRIIGTIQIKLKKKIS